MLADSMRTLFISILLTCTFAAAQNHHSAPTMFNEATVAQLQADMAAGKLTSVELTQFYLTRIFLLDQKGPEVNSVIQLNPDVLAQARNADEMHEAVACLCDEASKAGPTHRTSRFPSALPSPFRRRVERRVNPSRAVPPRSRRISAATPRAASAI